MGKQRVGLKHHRHVALVGGQMGDIFAANQNPPRGGMLQPGQQSQRGGFAAAGWPEQRHQRTRLYGE